jgi:hypothetical protein
METIGYAGVNEVIHQALEHRVELEDAIHALRDD